MDLEENRHILIEILSRISLEILTKTTETPEHLQGMSGRDSKREHSERIQYVTAKVSRKVKVNLSLCLIN
jgi:hypothetical protein